MGRHKLPCFDDALSRKRESSRRYYYNNKKRIQQKYYDNSEKLKNRQKQYYSTHKEQYRKEHSKLQNFKDELYFCYKNGLIEMNNDLLPNNSLNIKNRQDEGYITKNDKKILIKLLCRLYNEKKIKLNKKEKHKIKATAREERKKVVIKILYKKYKKGKIEI